MNPGLIKVTPDKEKAKSILKMAQVSLELVQTINAKKYPSTVLKDYYEIIRELISALALLDGFKAVGEGAHKDIIDYVNGNYTQFSSADIYLMDDLRIKRHRISYDGFFVSYDYLERRINPTLRIINMLKRAFSRTDYDCQAC